jgi:hypothetical protein
MLLPVLLDRVLFSGRCASLRSDHMLKLMLIIFDLLNSILRFLETVDRDL